MGWSPRWPAEHEAAQLRKLPLSPPPVPRAPAPVVLSPDWALLNVLIFHCSGLEVNFLSLLSAGLAHAGWFRNIASSANTFKFPVMLSALGGR